MKGKKKNQGFTLVELIVVITIIAILAAIVVPSCIKYIDRAREKEVLLKGRSAMMIAQTELSDAYGRGVALVPATGVNVSSSSNTEVYNLLTEILRVAEFADVTATSKTGLDKTVSSIQFGTAGKYSDSMTNIDARKAYTIVYFSIKSTKGTAYYANGEWTTELASFPAIVEEVYTIDGINTNDASVNIKVGDKTSTVLR